MKNAATEERFWNKVDKTEDCWLWTAAIVGKYGQFWVDGHHVYAHRFSYELLVGPIPKDLELDHRHTCLKHCVNPEHLRLATSKQNAENRVRFHSKSGLRGVYWDKRRNRWFGLVIHNSKRIHTGYFRTVKEADAAVVAKRLELFTHNDADREMVS